MKTIALTIFLLLASRTLALPYGISPIWGGIDGVVDVDYIDDGSVAEANPTVVSKYFREINFGTSTAVVTTAAALNGVTLPITIVFWARFTSLSGDWNLVKFDNELNVAKFQISRDTGNTKWVISDGTNTADFVDNVNGLPITTSRQFWEITITDTSVLTIKIDGTPISHSTTFNFAIPDPMSVTLGDASTATNC